MKLNEDIYTNIKEPRDIKTDFVVPICMFLLIFMGSAFIYSSQSYNIDEVSLFGQFWFKQIIFFCFVGMPIYIFLALIDYKVFFTYANIVYILSLILLVPLALKENLGIPIPLVESRFNATRWINLGVLSIQPSELAKIGTCIMASSIFAKQKSKKDLRFWLKIFAVFSIPISLIFLQPDLGSTLVFYPMLFAMLYISNLPKRFFFICILLFSMLLGVVWADIYGYNSYLVENKMSAQVAASSNAYGSSAKISLPLKDYQRNRILAFVAPEMVDPQGNGVSWNQRQSLISVGSGGFLGKGHTEGTQAKLGYLPSSVAYNDFIFSVIAEESGFIGSATVIILLAVILIYGCLMTAQLSRDKFGQYLCIGIGVILMTHSFINVGMTIGIMPITGLPLPMLSYGGTFVITCCILLGLVQSVYRHRKKYV